MIELEFQAAKELYNYDFETASNLPLRNAFYEYCNNTDFRTVIDLGAFVYVEEQFVIRNDKYVTKLDGGGFTLTNHAKANITECALEFGYHIDDMSEHSKKQSTELDE